MDRRENLKTKTVTLGNIPSLMDLDRFIPSKKTMTDLEVQLQSKNKSGSLKDDNFENMDPEKSELDRNLKDELLRKGVFLNQDLYADNPYRCKTLYSFDMVGRAPRCRPIKREPFKVLDAPFLQDDFYLNVIDWSDKNVLGVGLGNAVYTWNFHNNQVDKLVELPDEDLVSAVTWDSSGHILAVGSLGGGVAIHDVNKGTMLI